MPKCKFCNHLDRDLIETKILTGRMTYAEASRIVGCSDMSIKRHMTNHVENPAEVIEAYSKPMSEGVVDAYAMLTKAVNYCDEIIENAKKENNINVILMAMAELRRTIETMGKLFEIQKTGEKELASNKVELTIKVIDN